MQKQLNQLVASKILKWTPWVGKDYMHSTNKLLIIGESHYFDPTKEESIKKHENTDFTRICIQEIGINKEYKKYSDKRTARLFPNFHKTVFGNDTTQSNPLWESVAYYNFIQVPMHSNKKRPTTNEILNGWNSFFDVVRILEPDQILFIGSTVLDKFKVYCKTNDLKLPQFTYTKIEKNQISRHFEFEINNKIIAVNSIRHCSSHFSINKWKNFLYEKEVFSFIK